MAREMSDDQGRVDPASAALTIAKRLGLGVERASVVGTGNHVLVRLEPGATAARVTADGTFARFAGDLDTEVRLAAELHAAGAPVVPPLAGVAPRAYELRGREVTFWLWWAERDGDECPATAGRALATCHRVMAAGVRAPLSPWSTLQDARSRLSELTPGERTMLAPHLEPPDVELQPVHGDAHFANVLAGPVWHDWEDAQLACVEWDLACLVAPGRVVGMDFGYGEAILAGYGDPYDPALLDRCVAARTAQQAVYGLLLGDALPGLPERVRARLEWLAGHRG